MLKNKNINNLINNNEEKTMYTKQLFKWVQTNFNNYKNGNKALISNIYKEPLRVTFENQNIQNEMMISNDDIQWQNKYYLVDVEVLYDENKPKMYKILKIIQMKAIRYLIDFKKTLFYNLLVRV